MFTMVLLLITLGTALIPLFVTMLRSEFKQLRLNKSYDWLPVLAALCFLGAFFLPDIHISSETATFQQHFIGGGAYCALLYLYFVKLIGTKTNWLVGLALLFGWTSAFGVANELLEFTLTKLNLANIGTGDAAWDLLANTSGAITTYLLYLAARSASK